MSKLILLLITVVVAALLLTVTLACMIIAVDEKNFISLVYSGIILSVELIILINTVFEIFKLD